MRLDDVDKAIIDRLQADGRTPFSELGPIVGLSPAAARLRVLNLIERGVMQVVAVTDPSMVGLHAQALAGITVEGDLEETAKRLAEIEQIDYVVLTAGRFDIMIEVFAENPEELLSVMNGVRALEGVGATELFTYLRLEKQTYNWGTR